MVLVCLPIEGEFFLAVMSIWWADPERERWLFGGGRGHGLTPPVG